MEDQHKPAYLLPVACRFVPHDQWLTTHVEREWKVKQVKLWILSRCLGFPFQSSQVNPTAASQGVQTSRTTSLANIDTGAASATRYRPASPITFAPDPRRRPISPILFARSGGKSRRKDGRALVSGDASTLSTSPSDAELDESATEPSHDELDDDERTLEMPDGGGYEEDDEYDTAEESLENDNNPPSDPLTLPKKTQPAAGLVGPSSTTTSTTINQPSSIPFGRPDPDPIIASQFNTNASSYALIRFSTGQILEDDFMLSWYDIAPHELLELHAHLPPQSLPKSFAVATEDSKSKSRSHKRHSRNPSNLSVTAGSSQGHGSSAGQVSTSSGPNDLTVYLPPLNRSSISSYILPYWEGWVRVLRVAWRNEPHFAHPAGGYGYGDGMGLAATGGGMGIGFVPAMSAGFGPPVQSHHGVSTGGSAGSGIAGDEAIWSTRNASGFDGRTTGTDSRLVTRETRRTTRLEWKLRWLVIQEGVLTLCKDREDPKPTQQFALSSLKALRGVEHLTRMYFAQPKEPRPAEHHSATGSPIKTEHPASLGRRHRVSTSASAGRARRNEDSDAEDKADHFTRQRYGRTSGVTLNELEGEDLRIACIVFKSGGKLKTSDRTSQGDHVSAFRVDPDGTKRYTSILDNYPRRIPDSMTSGEAVGYDDDYVVVKRRSPKDRSGTANRDSGKEKRKKTKVAKEKQAKGKGSTQQASFTKVSRAKSASPIRGPYLRKSSLPGQISSKTLLSRKGFITRDKESDRDSEKRSDGGDVDSGRGRSGSKSKEKIDWKITSAFGVGGKAKDKSAKIAKDKDKDKDDRISLGMGLGLGLGLVSGKDVKEKQQERKDKGKGRAVEERGAVVAQALAKVLSSGDEDGTAPGGTGPRKQTSEIHEDDRAEGTMEGTLEGVTEDEEGSESTFSEPVFATNRIHAHPFHDSQLNFSDEQSDADMSSSLSSPVFAHSASSGDDSSLFNEPDMAFSTDPNRTKNRAKTRGLPYYKYGYHYGHDYDTVDLPNRGQRRLPTGENKKSNPTAETSATAQEVKKDHEKTSSKPEACKPRSGAHVKDGETSGEWLVLDLGTDAAYSSILRVLHRAFSPPISSSFLDNVQNTYGTTMSTPTPTPTPTPFPSPTSPRPAGSDPHLLHWKPFNGDLSSTADSSRHATEPLSPSSTSSRSSSRFATEQPVHPAALAALSEHPTSGAPQYFGALPYPEWRKELVERARTAGVGDVSQAMKWIMWQYGHDPQDHSDIESEEGPVETIKSTAPALRKGLTSTSPVEKQSAYDSDSSDETGELIDVHNSEEESSEAEWHGWIIDLRRQHKAYQERLERKATVQASPVAPKLSAPKTLADDLRQAKIDRKNREPTATVTTMYSSHVPSGMSYSKAVSVAPEIEGLGTTSSVVSTPTGTLYSPSSSESLAHRKRLRALSFNLSQADTPQTSTYTLSSSHSHHGHSHSQSNSSLAILNHRRLPLPKGVAPGSLSHQASLTSGLKPQAEQLKRPSMPILTTEQTFSLLSNSVITPHSAVFHTSDSTQCSRSPPTNSPPRSPPATSHVPTAKFPSVESQRSLAVGPASSGPMRIPRRASSAGLISVTSAGGSLGRSTSIFPRGSNLRREAKEEESEPNFNTTDPQWFHRDPSGIDFRRPQRPKLSLTTSSAMKGELPQPARSPTTTKSFLRRVRSGSSLKSGSAGNEEHIIPRIDGGTQAAPAKKKKGNLVQGVERMVMRGLDSAMEFVEGK